MPSHTTRLTALALLLLGGAYAVPITKNAQAPFTADVPAGWEQRPLPRGASGVLVVAPGTPPPAIMQLFFGPYTSRGNDAGALQEFIGGMEATMDGGGQATVKRLSSRPLTVGGVRGTERSYTLTLKVNGAVVGLQTWSGIHKRNLLGFQFTTGPATTAAQRAAYSKFLASVKFK